MLVSARELDQTGWTYENPIWNVYSYYISSDRNRFGPSLPCLPKQPSGLLDDKKFFLEIGKMNGDFVD